MSGITLNVSGSIAHLQLHRPEVFNALTPDMPPALSDQEAIAINRAYVRRKIGGNGKEIGE